VVQFDVPVPPAPPEPNTSLADSLAIPPGHDAGFPGLLAFAGSTDRTLALANSDLVALLSSTNALSNGAAAITSPAGAVLPGATLPADNQYQAQLFYQGNTSLVREGLLSAGLSPDKENDPSAVARFLDEDGAFLDLWDRDQLLFPDSLPKVEEMLFPGGLPRADEMPLPDPTPKANGARSRADRPVETPLLAYVVEEAPASAPALADGPESVTAPGRTAGLALSSADVNRGEVSPVAQGEDPLRPYQIALGLLPFLPAFGFTPVTLRERVLASRRLWRELRCTWRTTP
jgi:hypothetical protein